MVRLPHAFALRNVPIELQKGLKDVASFSALRNLEWAESLTQNSKDSRQGYGEKAFVLAVTSSCF